MFISHVELLQRLDYNKETGYFIWKTVKGKKVKVGDRAGYLHHSGYRFITVNDKAYAEHRLAWFYITGEWPSGLIDHKNLNREDNRWENLREVEAVENQHNTLIRTTNRSGFQGVNFRRGKYRARIEVRGHRYILGDFDTAEEASRAYEESRSIAFGPKLHSRDDIERAIKVRAERVRQQMGYKPKVDISYIDRFHQSYEIDTETGCWNWIKRFDKQTGYGWFKAKELFKRGLPASRASWFIHNGPIKDRFRHVCHKCDNRKCVNPEHLFLGSVKENMADCVAKGRINRGEDRPQSKLTEEIVKEARRLRQTGMGWLKLAAKYGVAQNAIRSAVMGETWSHVDEPIPTYVGKPGNPRK